MINIRSYLDKKDEIMNDGQNQFLLPVAITFLPFKECTSTSFGDDRFAGIFILS